MLPKPEVFKSYPKASPKRDSRTLTNEAKAQRLYDTLRELKLQPIISNRAILVIPEEFSNLEFSNLVTKIIVTKRINREQIKLGIRKYNHAHREHPLGSSIGILTIQEIKDYLYPLTLSKRNLEDIPNELVPAQLVGLKYYIIQTIKLTRKEIQRGLNEKI